MSPITPSDSKWAAMAPYAIPPAAAAVAIVPVYRDLMIKSDLQMGKPVPSIPLSEGMKQGVKATPALGTIIGAQMLLQPIAERALAGQFSEGSLSSKFASAALVGAGSAPALLVFNGQTAGQTFWQSLRRISPKQCFATAVQETCFIGGISAADYLAASMREEFGNNKAVDYTAAFVAGAAGSLAGHPANTAITRWQNGLEVESFRQLWRGSLRKARAIGSFSVIYKLAKEALNSTTVPASKS